jgi:CheY-like chemotaxis protein
MSRVVLVVDDDDDIRELATFSLESFGGWTVVGVASGEEALAAIEAGSRFDAIILDGMMPALDGPATFERLRSSSLAENVPIVFLTAGTKPDFRARIEALDTAGVITKPFDVLAFPAELDELIASWPGSGAADPS